MKTLHLILAAAATIVIVGCGGGGNPSSGEENAGETVEEGGSGATINALEANNIKDRLASSIGFAQNFVSGTAKKVCHKIDADNSYTMKWNVTFLLNRMAVFYTKYSNENCTGSEPMRFAEYRVTIGEVINDGKAVEVDLQFVSGANVVAEIPSTILGSDIEGVYYTTVVSSGTHQDQNIVWGVAKPTDANDGSSSSKRATDVSDYTTGKFYFTY